MRPKAPETNVRSRQGLDPTRQNRRDFTEQMERPEYNGSVKTLLLAAMWAPAISLWAQLPQPLMVYTELAKIDTKGRVTSPAFPREILSPAIVRNGFTSFQVVVDAPEGKLWELYVAQNPENAVAVTVFKVSGDRLEKVAQPVTGSGAQVFWLDLHAAAEAPLERIKVEPQLHLDDDWIIYPMEGRITERVVPNAPANGWPTGTATPEAVLRGVVCGTAVPAGNAGPAPTLAGLRFRNAQQDKALAVMLSKADLQQRFGACEAAWPSDNPERYLRVRDLVWGPGK
jgi:hypothetical protein